MNQEHFITTGEFAKLCGTTKETLFHYDKIGILKPARIGENGYRYYTPAQFFEFDLIRMMKYTGSSLKDIRRYFQNYETDYLLEIFRAKQKQIENKRKELEQIEKFLKNTVQMTEEALSEIYDVPKLEERKEARLLVTPMKPGDGEEDNTIARCWGEHLKKCGRQGLMERLPLSTIIPRKEILRGRSLENHLFSQIPEGKKLKKKTEDILIKPGGIYAVIVHRGAYESFDDGYRLLLNYIKEQKLEVCGDGYVYDLVSYLVGGIGGNYVVRIEIPVKAAKRGYEIQGK